MKKSLYRHLLLPLALLLTLFFAGTVYISEYLAEPVLWTLALTLVVILTMAILLQQLLRPLTDVLQAINDGVSAFQEDDFSLSIHKNGYREVEDIVSLYNQVAGILRAERMNIFQRELLLDTLIQSTPVAMLLTDNRQRVVYSNHAAKQLLNANKSPEGFAISQLIALLPEALQQATHSLQDGLVTYKVDDQTMVFNVNFQQFMLNGQNHSLYLYKNLSQEMGRKETELWKTVIRMISHELNNSLAPIASLTSSARRILAQPEHLHMLNDVLETIERRSQHLSAFIKQYAQFAKMPPPHKERVQLKPFFEHLKTLLSVHCELDITVEAAHFDVSQIEQVLINLVKNARESGSEEQDIGFRLTQQANKLTFLVFDRGAGLSPDELQQALLPFYTTKEQGSGIGLALCNEIVAAHGGKLRLYNREHGGLCVSFEFVFSST
ncbi:sensor histidine kinase [Planctobacterium marinum]|uniref:sensor histidine kinase n=1 Tax=Planctobacterium marinum TaxID=1631968 RepID=UPI001E481A27|nr:ATP-binding protein [Planctobacterium marinum]MCC2605190.1 histidine kinase [Planctobacterium marinum]